MEPIKHFFETAGPWGECKVAYTEWGNHNSEILFCVHGLTRNSRDFDDIANVLDEKYRVICPDVPGRGESDNFTNPEDYNTPIYGAVLLGLMAHLKAAEIDWLGTSMGGIIGMGLASVPNSPIRRLIINDVGPLVPKEALQRIKSYLGTEMKFASTAELEQHLRTVHAPFGPLTDDQWAHLARHSSRKTSDGWTLKYDPKIAVPFAQLADEDMAFWEIWEQIKCPVLILRGAQSDLFPRTVAERMIQSKPDTQMVEFEGVGHAPALMSNEQIEAVQRWLT